MMYSLLTWRFKDSLDLFVLTASLKKIYNIGENRRQTMPSLVHAFEEHVYQ